MKRIKTLFLLLASISLLTSCYPEDEFSEHTSNSKAKEYMMRVGTSIVYFEHEYDFADHQSDSRGSTLLRRNDGTTFIASNENMTLSGDITYYIEGPQGDYPMSVNISDTIQTDEDGDFSHDFKVKMGSSGEVITSIKINLKLTIITDNGERFEKRFNFSNETLWDRAVVLAEAMFTYDLTYLGVKYWTRDGRTNGSPKNTTATYFDINDDIVLEQI